MRGWTGKWLRLSLDDFLLVAFASGEVAFASDEVAFASGEVAFASDEVAFASDEVAFASGEYSNLGTANPPRRSTQNARASLLKCLSMKTFIGSPNLAISTATMKKRAERLTADASKN